MRQRRDGRKPGSHLPDRCQNVTLQVLYAFNPGQGRSYPHLRGQIPKPLFASRSGIQHRGDQLHALTVIEAGWAAAQHVKNG